MGHILAVYLFCHLIVKICSTGQRYIYTGSTDGCVYIYDVVSIISLLDYVFVHAELNSVLISS